MKYCLAAAFALLTATSAATAAEIVPINPVSNVQGFGTLGTTTTLSIIAGVITVGVLVAGNDESASTTN